MQERLSQRSTPGAFDIVQRDDHIIALKNRFQPVLKDGEMLMSLGQLDELIGCALAYQNKAHGWLKNAKVELEALIDRDALPALINDLSSSITITQKELAGVPRTEETSPHASLQRYALMQMESTAQDARDRRDGAVKIDSASLERLVALGKLATWKARTGFDHAALEAGEAALGREVNVEPPLESRHNVPDQHERNDILNHLTDLYSTWLRTKDYDQRLSGGDLLAKLQDVPDNERSWIIERDIDFLRYFCEAWGGVEN